VANVLAIDQGTSGTKAIVVGGDGQVLAVAEHPLHPMYLEGGGVEVDPQALLDSVLTAGRSAAEAAGVRLDAVALANQGETVLAWDRDTGRPLGPALVWQDRRAEPLCAERREHADRVAALTGLVLDAYFSAPKMRWLRQNVTTDGVVTTSDTWLVHQLCGAFVTDAATASRSLVLGLDDVAWNAELLDLFDLGGEALPEIVGCDAVVGATRAFGGELPVTGLIVDQQAALLGEACIVPGTAKCTYGTGAFLLAHTGDAAAAVRWLTELGLVSGAEQLDTTAAAASNGVLCVPAFAGLAAPWWDATATASFSGLTLSSGPGQLVRAVLEGIAAQVAGLVHLIAADLGAPLTRLRVDGGLTRSAVLMQAQADLAQLPVDVYPHPHATAYGAAACARLALDPTAELADVVGGWVPSYTYEPRWSPDQAGAHLERWQHAAQAALVPEHAQ
jgi:glycerol kinase